MKRDSTASLIVLLLVALTSAFTRDYLTPVKTLTQSQPEEISERAKDLAEFFNTHSNVLVLTGAGISVPSGIPEYRDENGNWKHSRPVQYKEFMRSALVYRRYWARSTLGWRVMGRAAPNAAHRALAQLEAANLIDCVVTQNVDRLHTRAGQRDVVNLHGHLGTASCQQCHLQVEREALQEHLEASNADWLAEYRTPVSQKPDGDVAMEDAAHDRFVPPTCISCNGLIKPDVVFFGENIPASTSETVRARQANADALLVIGSSLIVFSGFRIARDFHQRSLPIGLINPGKTRADELVSFKYTDDASRLLPQVVELLHTD